MTSVQLCLCGLIIGGHLHSESYFAFTSILLAYFKGLSSLKQCPTVGITRSVGWCMRRKNHRHRPKESATRSIRTPLMNRACQAVPSPCNVCCSLQYITWKVVQCICSCHSGGSNMKAESVRAASPCVAQHKVWKKKNLCTEEWCKEWLHRTMG